MNYDPWIKIHSEIEHEKLHALGVISFRWNGCEFGLKILFAQATQISIALGLSITQDMGSVTICNKIREAVELLKPPKDDAESVLFAIDLYDVNRLNRNQLTHFLPAAIAGGLELRRNKKLGGVMGEPVPSTTQRWSHFLRQPAKVDSPMQETIHHEDAETIFGGVQGQGRA